MGLGLRVLVYAVVLAAMLSLIPCYTVSAGDSSDYRLLLEGMGIRVPAEYARGRHISYSITLGSIEVSDAVEEHLVLSFSGGDVGSGKVAYIATPGRPSLPYLVYTFIIEGYIDDVKLYVVPRSVKLVELRSKVLPAPKPLAYRADFENRIEYSPDEEVYGSSSYFPGILAEAKVYRGLLGKSIISVKVYPVQYSPARNRAVYIDRMVVRISYGEPRYIPFASNSILIIARPGLDNVLQPLIELYSAKGYSVTLMDTNQVYEVCEPALPIYEYPGFYSPIGIGDDVYQQLLESYNSTLALKIMGCLSATLGEYSHVLLVGNALDVPPSFYYQSLILYDFEPYEGWIPTDLFYADLDRDLVPDVFVGRIPFSDPQQVGQVVSKIVSWYQSPAAKSDKLVLTGGYPFLLPLMFGETALSTMVLSGETSSFYTVLQTRTSYNYTRENVLNVFQGNENALWFFLLMHGAGNAFMDPLLVEPNIISIELLATSYDLLTMAPRPGVPVVSSVACDNAAWDTDLVHPPLYMFTPPSIGQAMLLSPAGGIAYIGSARIAFEPGLYFMVSRGVVTAQFYGATYLHRKIISVYNYYRTLGMPVTLGQVVAEGMAMYLSEVIFDELAISEVIKLALLGDVALGLPVPEVVVKRPRIWMAEGENVSLHLDAEVMFYLAYGDVPVYKIGLSTIRISGEGTASVKVIVNRILSDARDLYYHRLVEVGEADLVYGRGVYRTQFDDEKSGKVLLKFCIPGWGELRYIAGAAGMHVAPERVVVGGRITVEAYGLDLLGFVRSVELIIAGVLRVEVPIDPVKGYMSWTTAMPYTRPGIYDIVISPRIEDPYGIPVPAYDIQALFRANVTVYGEEALDLAIAIPSVAELGKEVRALISTTYKGQPIELTDLDIEVRGPRGTTMPSVIERIAEGLYVFKFAATELGDYAILVRASYENLTLYAYGSRGLAVTVVDRLYGIGELVRSEARDVKALVSLLNRSISADLANIVNGIKILSNRTVVIETALGTITGRLIEINSSLMKVDTKAGVIIVRLDGLEDSIEGSIEVVKRELTQNVDSRAGELKNHIDGVSGDLERSIMVLKVMTGAVYAGLAVLGIVIYLFVIRRHR